MLVIGAVVLVLALVIGYAVTRSSNKAQAGSDIPLDILAMNASQLSNNNYVLDGTVIDRFPRGESELISFCTRMRPDGNTLFPSAFPQKPEMD